MNRRKERVVGDASPYYLFSPEAPELIKDYTPEAKIIILLRDPLERAHSHWVERTKAEVETLSFEEALRAEKERCVKSSSDPERLSIGHWQFGYTAQSNYSLVVPKWLELFMNNCLVIKSEELYANTPVIWNQVQDFLGLDRHKIEFPIFNQKSKPEISEEAASLFYQNLAAS